MTPERRKEIVALFRFLVGEDPTPGMGMALKEAADELETPTPLDPSYVPIEQDSINVARRAADEIRAKQLDALLVNSDSDLVGR